jgi:AmpE protein
MAIRLLVALIALGLLHVLPQLARYRDFGWFRRWVTQSSDTSGVSRILLLVLLPVAACSLVMWALGHAFLGDLLQLLFALVVLLYCIGPREFEPDVEAVLHAPDGASREAAAQLLADDGEPVAWSAPALGVAAAYAALYRRFGVLLWFFLLGPTGALLYRLAQLLGRDESLPLDSDSHRFAGFVANALNWLPAQLMVFTLAIVGHWEAVIGAWRQWHSQSAPTSWYVSPPGFLGAAAQADILTDIEAGDGYAEERTDPIGELTRLRNALLRALLTWLSVVALIVIGGWIS